MELRLRQYPVKNSEIQLRSSLAGFLFFLLIVSSVCLIPGGIKAQTLPGGFSQVMVASGISNPTVMAIAPDGRIFVAQQSGQLRIIKNGVLLTQPFISLSVNSSGERGLLGIAFDPNFNSNNYIYLYYTLSSAANNRISRFTANGDVVVAGSEQVVLNLDPLSSASNHNGGNMQFGPDGKLYVGVGENAAAVDAQILDTYNGKLLRINTDGSVPAGNPFTGGSAQQQRLWAYGLRNPYTITFQPGTGRLFVNDVGGATWEEINDATAGGKNFGWPYAEGGGSIYSNPLYAYGHGTSIGTGCAITGGTFFNPSSTNYPSTYVGRYFFLDFCGNWIDMLTLSGGSASRSNFASNIAGSPVSLNTGSDGNLYFLSRDNSAVYKIIYTASSAPVITNQPQSITVAQGNTATFSVSVTGSTPLSYQWRKNGTNISGATGSTYTISSVTSSSAGTFSVVVSNSSGNVTSNNATLTVTSPNQPPVATISTPLSGATYAGGNVINFSGTATDPENGNLAASAYTWYVIFHHGTHTHHGPTATTGASSGSFTIPTSGETATDVFYRLYLVATDPQGAKDTAYRDIVPRTSTITLNTNPQGLNVTLDGQPYQAPLTVTSVEGIVRSIGVQSPQTLNGIPYNFSSWSQGGAQTQSMATPVNNVAYTATFSSTIVITSQPQSLTVAPGNTATFSVAASGAAPLVYQWRKNGTNISGANSSSYTISSVTSSSAGSYSVSVGNSTGSVISNTATLTVTSVPVITSQPQSITVVAGNSATFSVTATGTSPLTYQWRRNGTNISGATSASYSMASVATTQAGTYSVVVSNSAGNTTSNNATLTVNTGSGGTTGTIFSSTATPANPTNNDGQGIELGVKFRSTQNGYITGVRYYKGAGTTGTHIGHLWSSTGTMLAAATFTNETTSGWQQVLFSSPVAITAGVTYVASQFSPSGHYASTVNYFTQAVVNGALRALANGEDGVNGVYRYSTASAFPTFSYMASNYWIDVVFSTGSTDVTAPVVTTVSPSNAATGVGISPAITATFSEAVNSSTVTGTTFQVKNSAGTIIGATVSTATNKITLSPTSALSNASQYTVTIKGGSTGVKDLAGIALSGDYSWSFTTAPAASTGTSATIFASTAVPANPINNDGQGIELGLKFRSSQNGYITGIRYYKGAGTTGTHIGHLWNSTGTMLAAATFTNETASGWQQVLFSTPVAITAGVTYVASQFSSSGHYASTVNYFTQAVVNGSLRALADGEDGINGVYRYSSSSAFPTSGHLSSNYWVDVVFVSAATTSARTSTIQSPSIQSQVQAPAIEQTDLRKLDVHIIPNPSHTFFNLVLKGSATNTVSVRAFDISGRVIEKHDKIASNSTLQLGGKWTAGSYFVEVIQGGQRRFVKIVKMN